MASPITWNESPAAWMTLTCHECKGQIPEGQPHLIRSFGRRYARIWCRACKAHLDQSRALGVAATA